MKIRPLVMILLAAALLAHPRAGAADYFVAPNGNDAWSGRLPVPNARGTDGPWRTLKQAGARTAAGDICHLRAGVYRETLRPMLSGWAGQPITFRNYQDEIAVLSGAEPLGGWQSEGGGGFSASMDWDLEDQNQLLDGEDLLTEARWPNNAGSLLQPTRARATAGDPGTLTDPNLPGATDDWNGATLWCAGGHKWICWSGRITGFDPESRTLRFDSKQAAGNWYTPRAGSEYVVIGARAALDAEGEWYYDRERRRVHLIPAGGQAPADGRISAKRRLHAIDLSGREHIHIRGLHFRAAGILTDADSKALVLDRLDGRYVAHSYVRDVSQQSGVLLRGERHVLRNSELSGSSGSILRVQGTGHRVVNNYLHTGNYGALWSGAVALAGRRHVVSHNTIRHSGRDLVSVHGLMESLIEHNDLSHAGWLTHDLGMIYGHNTDFMNTVIRYNQVHHNQAQGLAMGIYFDHLSHNLLVHHNAIWNVSGDALRINNPSYFHGVAQNTCFQSNTAGNARAITSFDHSHRQDLFGSQWLNNLLNAPLRLPDNAIVAHNLATADPGFLDPAGPPFVLQAGSAAAQAGLRLDGITIGTAPYLGAFPPDRAPWTAGHDFSRPPEPEPVWVEPEVFLMNRVYNASFETGTLEGWTPSGAGQARLTDGNGWGNNFGSGDPAPTGTSRHELRLGGGADGVEQRIRRLEPHTRYTLSAWVRVSDTGESVRLGVRQRGTAETSVSAGSTNWTRLTLEFTTRSDTEATSVFLEKDSAGPGFAWCDNVGLVPVLQDPAEPGQEPPVVQWWSSSEDGSQRLAAQPDLRFRPSTDAAPPAVELDPQTTYQSILGLGSSLEHSTCYNLNLLPPERRDEVLVSLLDPEQGIGMNLMRICIGTPDFTASPWYTYNDMPPGQTDPELKRFSIAKDREYVLPVLQAARRINPQLKFFASPWSPPAWMKTNDRIGGGAINPKYFPQFAEYLARFVEAYREEGIEIFALTVQNEPEYNPPTYPTCAWTAEQQRDFIRDHLGPLFRARNLETLIWCFDHNFDNPGFPATILRDPAAAAFVDGSAFHHYVGTPDAMTRLREKFPDKHLYFTEGSTFGTEGAAQIISFLRNWARTYNAWVTVIDHRRQPNPGPHPCSPTCIVLQRDTLDLEYRYDYFMYGQFMRFIQRDAVRIASSESAGLPPNVAFRNLDGSLILVVANPTDHTRELPVAWNGLRFHATLVPQSVATFRWRPRSRV